MTVVPARTAVSNPSPYPTEGVRYCRESGRHNPGPGTDLSGGDVRVSGRAVEVTDPAVVARYAAAVGPPEPFHLFRAELTEAVRTYTEDGWVVLESWAPRRPLRTLRRTSDDPALRVE
ncbi:hypothetical protein San01_63250 [Streptomyces angustmyceticus]|uniref:Pyridoxamine 5'-phosphate oxidase putative domain-containing protein n=1 Tax=Streptomyces angustmyceticus TaxID=285578 RepID=A0A5J4LI18_9ACTN|nr:hypothetical protein San01_63250 [Streptomyces angustmyceticus]